jgi:hypothetical protein
MKQQWEYLTVFVKADARREDVFLREMRDWKDGIPVYTPEALIPELNALGADGWELVHMQPVVVGDKRDVLVADSGSGGRSWANQYFCVFKRPVD